MKLILKILTGILMVTTGATALGYFIWYKPKFTASTSSESELHNKTNTIDAAVFVRLKANALQINDYIMKNHFNTSYCFIIDMHIAPGKKRFFVYNLQKDSIEISGLVTHGTGSDKGQKDLVFSNIPNSNCTSLGKYRIANSYYGKFGLAYKLQGLDKTNSNAYVRCVVLHAHSCVPNDEVYPIPICESWGCPTVAPAFLSELKKYIDNSERPVLLYIYY